jgi:two-component system phosphate regulon sensor histidine kinase PhoR
LSHIAVFELFRFVAVLTVSALIGALFDLTFLFLFIASSAFFLWYLSQISKLQHWMNNPKKEIPEATGIWGEIFNHIYQLQKRNKKQKKKLAAALTRFQQVAAALPDGAVILQGDNIIEWSNESAKRVLGIRSPHDHGQVITNLVRIPAFAAYLVRENFYEPLEIYSPIDHDTSLNIRVVPYGKEQRLLLARDMTKVHRLEQARKDFVANASHELRTPLTVMNGYLEMMESDQQEALQPYRNAVIAMHQQSLRMQNIVEDLLLLSKLENNVSLEDTDLIDINGLINEVASVTETLSGEKQQQVIIKSDCVSSLKGIYKEIFSAVSNLAYNAVHYTPVGGTITLHCREHEDGLKISVIDTGIGIAPQHIPRLTERFYRIDTARSRDTGGTGLGLAIVKHVLMRHQGRLSIESEVGKGSTFSCHFPISQLQTKPVDVIKVS